MPIPAFDEHGLLPAGVHECSAQEIADRFGWNPHRQELLRRLSDCLVREIRSRFNEPVYVDGSFVTDKEVPEDVDVVLDMTRATREGRLSALNFMVAEQGRLRQDYSIHFLINLPGGNDFSDFFQYLGVKPLGTRVLIPRTARES